MEKEKNKVVPLLIVIVLLLVCCVGFLGYKLFLGEDDNKVINDNDKTGTTTTTPTLTPTPTQDGTNVVEKDELIESLRTQSGVFVDVDNNLGKSIKQLFDSTFNTEAYLIDPKVTDSEIRSNIKNLDKSYGNYKIVVNCDNYYKEGKYCQIYKVKINSKVEYKVRKASCSIDGFAYKYNNYYVVFEEEGCIGSYLVKVYDKNYNVVYSNEDVYSLIRYFINGEESEEFFAKPFIRDDGKLYFLEDKNKKGNADTMSLISIDLSKETIEIDTIGSYKLSHSSQ